MKSKPVWGHKPRWRARLAALWHVLLGRSVLFNVWIETEGQGGISFDGMTYMVGGGVRGAGHITMKHPNVLRGAR